MGVRFRDGPAKGLDFGARRAPHYLRVVAGGAKGRFMHGERWDLLDLPGDEPEVGERVVPYRLVEGTQSVVFVRPGGRFESGEYEWLDVEERLLDVFRVRSHFVAWGVMDYWSRISQLRATAQVLADLAVMDVDTFRAGAVEVGAVGGPDDTWWLA